MCLVVALILAAFSISSALHGAYASSLASGVVSLFFLGLLVRNVIKNKECMKGGKKCKKSL
jgi:hypothetical protein